jgi:hypothetical protein
MCERNAWKKGKWAKEDNKEVWVTTYIDPDKRCVLIEDEPALNLIENPLGFTPAVIIPSGLGQDSYEGKPEYKYRDIIYAYRQLIEMANQEMAHAHFNVSHSAYERLVLYAQNKEEAMKAMAGYNDDPEQILVLQKGAEELMRQQGQPFAPNQLAWVSGLLDMTGASPVLQGEPATGDYSGSKRALMVSYAKLQYKLALTTLEYGWAEWLGMAFKAIEVLNQPVKVRGFNPKLGKRGVTTVNPSDAHGCDIHVRFKADSPEEAELKRTQGAEFYRAGILPLKQVLVDYYDMTIEQADKVWKELQVQGALETPTIKALLAAGIAKEWSWDEAYQAILMELQGGPELQRGGDNRMPETMPVPSDTVPQYAERAAGAPYPQE